MNEDTLIYLPSGCEISVEAARGDIARAIEALSPIVGMFGLANDLQYVSELLDVLSGMVPDEDTL